MTSTIARVDDGLARACRSDRLTDSALLAAAVFCFATLILIGIAVANVYKSAREHHQEVGAQWP